MAAGTTGHGRLRASHGDRELVIDTLKAAFVQGRLSKDELDVRVGQVLASRTYADLAAVTADIPAGMAAAQPQPAPDRARARKPMTEGVKAVAWSAGIPLAGLLVAVATATGNAALFLLSVFCFIGAVGVAWGAIVEALAQKRSRGQLPQASPPGAGGQASRRSAPAAQAKQLPKNHGQQHTAEAAPSRLTTRHGLARGHHVIGALAGCSP